METVNQAGIPQERFDKLIQDLHIAGEEVIRKNATDVDAKARFPQESMDEIKKRKLLGAYIPEDLGGLGMNISQVAKICEILGQYCGSTAMIFAMHQIQVACALHNGISSEYFKNYLKRVASEQRLLASATTEMGVGGDLRSSICAVETDGERFTLTKNAPVISYMRYADDLFITARKNSDAPANDQVQVVLSREDYELEPSMTWDTMGFRGTCSEGFLVKSSGHIQQIIPTPFADILSHTMHPTAHILWGSLWLGIATDAVNLARTFVRELVKKNPNTPQSTSIRLAEVHPILQGMRENVHGCTLEYQNYLAANHIAALDSFSFSVKINNLKISCSSLIIEIVSRSLMICGIAGYRNDTKYSLSRHLRDAYGASLMVNNDRIINHNAALLHMHRGD
ncbi:acyl-CoA dehydrogenase family protein [Chloroflexota bacterium]